MATLESIEEDFGLREGPNEDEPTAHYVELIGLNFVVESVKKGDQLEKITIPWYGFVRENVDGRPGERSARIELSNVRFTDTDIGSSFMLFLKQAEDGSLRVVSATNGMARVTEAGGLAPLALGGVFGNQAEPHTVAEVDGHIESAGPLEDGVNAGAVTGDGSESQNGDLEPGGSGTAPG